MVEIVIAFLKGIKGISEKHLIPGACSFVLVLITYFLWDTESQLLLKLGVTYFMWLFFLIYLLTIEFIVWIISKVKIHINKIVEENRQKKENDFRIAKSKEEETKRKEELLKQQLNDMWDYTDKLDNSDYNYLMQFIESGNTQISVEEDAYRGSKIFKSKLVHCTVLEVGRVVPVQPQNREQEEGTLYMPIIQYVMKPTIYGCVLTDEVYELLKISQSTYGRISHFNK